MNKFMEIVLAAPLALLISTSAANADTSKCMSLTGVYELYMGSMQLDQSGCGQDVKITRTIRTKSGGVFVTEYSLDGIKRYSPDGSANQLHIWQDNKWLQYHEVQSGGGISKMGGAHYLNADLDLVKEDFNPRNPTKIYKRIK